MRLSPEQRQAVAAGPGPVRVLAGAGTGKTAVIVERFLKLVEAGAQPAQVLVMTFTERAAAEMRERIEARLEGRHDLSVGTFHALAQRWLREDWRAAGVPAGFGILSGAERWILAWELLWELGAPSLCDVEHPEHQVGPLLRLLERLKQELIPLSRLGAWIRRAEAGERRDVLAAALRLFQAYGAECRRRRLLDFDDLLARGVRMLERDQAVLARYRLRYPWVLVDEYQDTNLAQERIVELIAGQAGEVFAVGDDDQSIYRFRGASRASLERFGEIFSGLRTLTLTRNRRSTRAVVEAASALVAHNLDRVPKRLTAEGRGDEPVEIWACAEGQGEALAIAAEVRRLHAGGLPLDEIAVLTRTNAIAAPIARVLREQGLPCRSAGWWGFFDRPVCKDLLAALLVLQSDDAIAAERLGPGFGRLREQAWSRLRHELQIAARRLGVNDLFFELMERSGYAESEAGAEAASDVQRFADLVGAFCERAPDQSLDAFLLWLELVQLSGAELDISSEAESEPSAPAVQVMTIHQAKGLEFEAVFVPALVDGRLPQPPRRDRFELPTAILEPSVRGREDHLAEERRLLYVAMTRSRSRLYLSWAERYEGGRRWRRSPFLAELAEGQALQRTIAAVPTAEPAAARSGSATADEPLSVSFSSLSAYRECPRLHWFRYVRRLRPPATPEGHLGDTVHRVLMRIGERRRGGDRVNVALALRELAEAWAEQAFPVPRREGVYRRLAEGMVAGYVAEGGFETAPLELERAFTAAIDGFALRGVIDRVDPPAGPGGAHVVIDYKTGASLPAARLRRDFQLALYALGAQRELGLDALDLEIAYLRDGKRIRLAGSPELLAEAERQAVEAVAGIRRGDFEPQPERRRCRSCPYRLACDAAM